MFCLEKKRKQKLFQLPCYFEITTDELSKHKLWNPTDIPLELVKKNLRKIFFDHKIERMSEIKSAKIQWSWLIASNPSMSEYIRL